MHSSAPDKNLQFSPEKSRTVTARPARQKAFISALVECFFNVTAACEQAGISRRTYYAWLKNFPAFRADIIGAEKNVKDGLEAALAKVTAMGEVAQIAAALRLIYQNRGYSEKELAQNAIAKILEEVLAGKITAREAGFRINGMGLPIPQVLLIELMMQKPEGEDPGEPAQDAFDRRIVEACQFQKYQFASSFQMGR